MRLTRAIGPALGASLVLLAGACGQDSGDSPDSASDPSASASPSETTTETPAAPVDPIDFGDEPAVEATYKKAALRAVDDDLITMVPSTLPDGWTTVGGGYQPDPQWWRMEFTAPTGDVVLDQLPGTADEALGSASGLTSVEAVDLTDWGTGPWAAWDHSGAAVLAYDLKGSTVVLQGPDVETVRSLAESLLPAEDASKASGREG
ncbi:hypothetical protein F4692_002632 [Nocardioides cavernae]|uniref:DUF4245 domain-containing protein n=1 Tax=Nocardioides cavernae TaxID=1921566 RepID=A0A7Y9KSD7_9ACTN|nr:hypothetical protein [Nocardioides cavernae]NYE37499.1 hypothetical protein [Nocardioides cavernae]